MDITNDTILMRCDDFIFYNAKAIFVEYIDIIRSPYFNLLYMMAQSKEPSPLFDTSKIAGLDIDDLGDYYYNKRISQNPFYDLINFDQNPDLPKDIYEKVDLFADSGITEQVLQYSNELNFVRVLENLMGADSLLAKKVIIYYPYDNPAIRSDVEELFSFNEDIEFQTGPLEEVLSKVPADATYVFSDIYHIETLKELGKLNFASILIPMEYGYNYTDPDNKESDLLLDIEAYMKEDTFKFDMFLASVTLPEREELDEEEPNTPDETST